MKTQLQQLIEVRQENADLRMEVRTLHLQLELAAKANHDLQRRVNRAESRFEAIVRAVKGMGAAV